MRSAITKRDILGIFVICGLAALFSMSAHEAITTAFQRQITKDVEHTARGWADFITRNTADIESIAEGTTPSTGSLRLIQMAREVGDVFRFKLFDGKGRLRFVSDDPFKTDRDSRNLDVEDAAAARVLKRGRPITRVREGTGHGQPALYAQTYLPVIRDGRTVAIVEVNVDQTAKREIFGEAFLIAVIFTPLLIAAGFAIPAIAFLVRTRQMSRIESEMAESHRHLKAVLDNMSQGFCMFDADQRLVLANDQYLSIYNLPKELGVPGTPVRESLERRVSMGVYAGDDPAAYIEERMRCVARQQYHRAIHQLPDGRVLAVTHKPLPDGGWLTTHDDITELQRIERRITYLAHHDPVTGLPNRTSFRTRVASQLESGSDSGFAVLCLDLDHFKSVNDTLGHPVGDRLLQEVAQRLRNTVAGSDSIARLGGDEFALIQVSSDQPRAAAALATRICEVFWEPFELDGHQVTTGTSIGIAVAGKDGTTPEDLLKNADLALYEAKDERRGSYKFFDPEMATRMNQRRQMEIDLRTALRDGQFDLRYQPLVDARSNTVSGFEALLRWHHPERGVLAPSEFVPLAEEIGLIVPLGEWVLREACAEAAKWPETVSVAINVSAAQFRSGKLVPMVINALSSTGLATDRLELEITEAILTQYSETTLQTLHMLRNLGVRITMDDFGTGSSSLNFLRRFPFDKLKIHRSLIDELDKTDDARAIVRTISGLGNALGMSTTAEGVETWDQLVSVQAEGFTEIQGFLYSHPISSDEVLERYFPNRAGAAHVA